MESIEKLENYRIRWMQNVDVHLMITEQCNYSCRHCLIGDKNSVVEKKLVFRIIDDSTKSATRKSSSTGARYSHSRALRK